MGTTVRVHPIRLTVQPFFSHHCMCVIALEDEDEVWISEVRAKIADIKVATKHGNDLCGIVKSIDADEVWVVASR